MATQKFTITHCPTYNKADAQMSKSVYHRLGVGGELWFDNARFTANGYYGLTHNRDVDEKPGYYAEVAHGYDVNLQAWLPGYRQLSGRVKFEQYLGDRVAFTKKGQDARNPYALSLGLNYAPIPLLQFDVDRVLGSQKQTENRFGVSVRYQFGVHLSLQLDPTHTASQYLRKAKNYHVVDRNSAIVLSFREKPSQQTEKPVIKKPVTPKPPVAPPTATPKQPEVPPTETPEEPPTASPGGDSSSEWGTPPLDTDGPSDNDDKASPPYNAECNLFIEGDCPKNETDEVKVFSNTPIFVHPPSSDGMLLKAIPSRQESHVLVDEGVNAEGFVIVDPSATKMDTPDDQYGFEFVCGS